jgi:hypothetical protein
MVASELACLEAHSLTNLSQILDQSGAPSLILCTS